MTVVWMVILVGLPLCRWLANKNRRLRTQLEEQRLLFSQMDLESFSPEEEFSPKAHDLAGGLTGGEKRSPGEGLCLDRGMRKVYRGKCSGSGFPGENRWGKQGLEQEKSGSCSAANRAPLLATAGVFRYNRNNKGRVIPFPADHRGGA